MIDWVTARLPLSWVDPVNDGYVVRFKADGSQEWCTDARLMVEGSFSAKISVRTVERGFIEFSGNPAKFLQGHNIFGCNDLCLLVSKTMKIICKKLSIIPTWRDVDCWARGFFDISRIDINEMFELESRSQVRDVLRILNNHANIKYKKGVMREGTLYFGLAEKGKRASDWQMKMYCKADELHIADVPQNADDWEAFKSVGWGGTLPEFFPYRDKLCAWVDNKLRVEMTFRTRELRKHDAVSASMWSEKLCMSLFVEYFSKLNVGEVEMARPGDVECLPRAIRRTFNQWMAGQDVRADMSRSSFYEHRAAILEALGKDIALAPQTGPKTVVLREVICLDRIAGVPSWADRSILANAA